MEFLDKLVLPQSAHHMVLLKYLLALTNFIFLAYICVLIGTMIYSLYFKDKALHTGENKYLHLAKELVDILTPNRVIAVGLGIVPLISIAFGYLQLLHESTVNISGIFLLALISITVGLILVYAYKQNINLSQLLNNIEDDSSVKDDRLKNEIHSQNAESKRIYEKAGKFGVIFLLIAAYLFAGATKLAEDTARWSAGKEVFTSIFSIGTLAYFVLIVCLSVLAASSVVLYFYFRPNNEYAGDETNLSAIKDFASRNGLITSLLIPILISFIVISFGVSALSYSIFLLVVVVFMLIILISSLFYLMMKNSSTQYSLTILFLIIILFMSIVGVNIAAFDTATQLQFNQLAKKYDVYHQQILIESGAAVVTVSGKDIYNGRCIACHKFDTKLVGPPYNEVLPKYAEDRTSLIKFVLNPVKVNPDYPPMPNQGLKPNEAEAIADYILSMYKSTE